MCPSLLQCFASAALPAAEPTHCSSSSIVSDGRPCSASNKSRIFRAIASRFKQDIALLGGQLLQVAAVLCIAGEGIMDQDCEFPFVEEFPLKPLQRLIGRRVNNGLLAFGELLEGRRKLLYKALSSYPETELAAVVPSFAPVIFDLNPTAGLTRTSRTRRSSTASCQGRLKTSGA